MMKTCECCAVYPAQRLYKSIWYCAYDLDTRGNGTASPAVLSPSQLTRPLPRTHGVLAWRHRIYRVHCWDTQHARWSAMAVVDRRRRRGRVVAVTDGSTWEEVSR
jgi:hypothetical protein